MYRLLCHGKVFGGQQIMLVVLGLIDVVMISNLLVMVIVGGYETFVSRLRLHVHPDQPEWLSHVNAGILTVQMAMAIIGLSSTHMMLTFIESSISRSQCSRYTSEGVVWQLVILCVLHLSGIGIDKER